MRGEGEHKLAVGEVVAHLSSREETHTKGESFTPHRVSTEYSPRQQYLTGKPGHRILLRKYRKQDIRLVHCCILMVLWMVRGHVK